MELWVVPILRILILRSLQPRHGVCEVPPGCHKGAFGGRSGQAGPPRTPQTSLATPDARTRSVPVYRDNFVSVLGVTL